MALLASDRSAEMAKTSGIVKNSTPVGKSSSSRESHPDDLDTVLVVASDEIKKAREAVESVTSETATIDCHPVILDDSEESTDRFVDKDASRSGLVPKTPLKVSPRSAAVHAEREPDTTTMAVPKPLPTMIDAEEEDGGIEISASGIISEELQIEAFATPKGKTEPRATITEVREVEPIITREVSPSVTLDEETATEERPKVAKLPPRFDDETLSLPKADLASLGGALETVPMNAALVQNVIAQVDARAAARATGQRVPQFQLPTGLAQQVMPPQQATPRQQAPQNGPTAGAQMHGSPMHGHPIIPATPPARRLGVEVFITMLAFLAVAVPALYYLYLSYSQ